ncbi:UNVERIFIED_CONTAM: type IX secretion system membrane protein PorP/SprF, partial [Salmonella enterica subsp. enterica serovar Weltevreden]
MMKKTVRSLGVDGCKPARRLMAWLPVMYMLAGFSAGAQDAQFTQFYASPMYLNPAFTG